MTCEQCGTREAVVILKQVEGAEVRILHLCEPCAAERGVEDIEATAKTPLGAFLAAMGKEIVAEPSLPGAAPAAVCQACGASLQDFRESGRLGCAECWTTFEGPLRGLLRRVHGTTHHVGELYQTPGEEPTDPGALVSSLRAHLRSAVESENFELAAELRDRLRGME